MLALGLVALASIYITRASAASTAPTARTLNVTDEAHLRLTGTQGSVLLEEGTATGTMPGAVKVRFAIDASISGSFTIYTENGSISGSGSAQLHSTHTYSSFGGAMTVSHGTGHYTHAHGHGGFYGTVNRHTEALVIQTTGQLSY